MNEQPGSAEIRARIQSQIERLNSLVDGQQASAELVAFGGAAVEPLRRFVFDGAPSGIFQPRQWAIEALAALGAKDVLMDYLAREEPIADPVARHGEDAVQNTAACLLAEWKSDDVFDLLLGLARKRILPGFVTALGALGRVEALPILERALEDDVARPAAEEALGKFGGEAIAMSIATVTRKEMNEDEEVPSSLRRRRAAAEILSTSTLDEASWPKLEFLLDESDPELVVHAAKLAVYLAPESDKRNAVASVLRVLPESPWYLKEEATKSLEALYAWGEAFIENEIERRNQEPPLKRAADDALLTLTRLRNHMRARR